MDSSTVPLGTELSHTLHICSDMRPTWTCFLKIAMWIFLSVCLEELVMPSCFSSDAHTKPARLCFGCCGGGVGSNGDSWGKAVISTTKLVVQPQCFYVRK